MWGLITCTWNWLLFILDFLIIIPLRQCCQWQREISPRKTWVVKRRKQKFGINDTTLYGWCYYIIIYRDFAGNMIQLVLADYFKRYAIKLEGISISKYLLRGSSLAPYVITFCVLFCCSVSCCVSLLSLLYLYLHSISMVFVIKVCICVIRSI